MNDRDIACWLVGGSLALVTVMHVWTYFYGLAPDEVATHSVLNLIAAGLGLVGWYFGKTMRR